MLSTHLAGKAGSLVRAALAIAAMAVLSGCAGVLGNEHTDFNLSGAEEVPPVTTAAHGSGLVTVRTNRAISGRVTTIGLAGVAAHLHLGERGENGPVAIGLVKIAENIWAVPVGTVLDEQQYRAFLKGRLYVNVHTAAHKGGEIRGQLLPLASNW